MYPKDPKLFLSFENTFYNTIHHVFDCTSYDLNHFYYPLLRHESADYHYQKTTLSIPANGKLHRYQLGTLNNKNNKEKTKWKTK